MVGFFFNMVFTVYLFYTWLHKCIFTVFFHYNEDSDNIKVSKFRAALQKYDVN